MKRPFSLTFAGQSLIHESRIFDGNPGLVALQSLLSRSDVAFTNLETTILGRHGGWPLKGSYFGCSEPAVLQTLRQLGFNMISLANNHAFDLGPSGVLSTIEASETHGFLWAGIGRDRTEAGSIASKPFADRNFGLLAMDAGPGPDIMYAEDRLDDRMARPGVNRLAAKRIFEIDDTRFDQLASMQALFSTSPLELANYAQPDDPQEVGSDELDFYGTTFRRSGQCRRQVIVQPESAAEQLSEIQRGAERGDFVIAYLHHHHWEPAWKRVPDWVREFAYDCVDAGAKAFVSHGVPVLQPIEIYAGVPIFYGLGNFIFHTESSGSFWQASEVWRSIIATSHFDQNDRLARIDLHPIVVGGAQSGLRQQNAYCASTPVLADGRVALEILTELASRCEEFGTFMTIGEDSAQIDL